MINDFKPTLERTKPSKKEVTERLVKNPLLAIRELNNRSFYNFLKFMWPAYSSERFQDNWHIKYVCDQLQEVAEQTAEQRSNRQKERVDDMIINVPPGTTKTTMVSIMFPAWCWTRWYWMEFIGLSYSSTLSLEAAEAQRDLIRSDRFKAVYPDLSIKADKDQKSNFQLLKQMDGRPGYKPSKKQGGSRYSTSVGGTLTGFHGHMILVDDPINPEQAVSPKQLKNVNRWLDQTLPTRKVHKVCSPVIYVMQRLHEDDPTGHKLDKEKGNVKHICLPGEIRNYEDEVSPQHLKEHYSDDGLLDPIRMTWDVLDDLKADLGQYGFAGQVGQSPTPPSGGMFKVDRMQVVDQLPQKHEIIKTVRYWDKAGTEAKQEDKNSGPAYTVGVKMSLLKSGKFLIRNVVRGRWGSAERESKIRQTTEADGHDVIVGVEQEPGSGGKESAEATVKNLRGYTVKVERPTGDKIYRADPYSVQVNNRNVMMMQGDWNKDFKEEHRFFPFGTFKDQVDAAAGAFALLNKQKEARVIS